MKYLLLISLILLSGCSLKFWKKGKVEKGVMENSAKLTEESAALTTGIVDVLSVAPSNRHTEVALDLAKHDQQIEGVPSKRIDVQPLISGEKDALKSLQARFDYQSALLKEKSLLEARLKESEAKLIEMGRLYEEEKNRSIVKRIWRWSISTLGIGGLIALCVFFPALIPLIGQFFGWIVAKIPKLAGAFGVVSKKAFDGVVLGVEKIRDAAKENKELDLETINAELLKATDSDHRVLIEKRKAALGV